MNEQKQIKEILSRLERLEKEVFPKVKTAVKLPPKDQKFSGAKGGVLFLISKGYFGQHRAATEVKDELSKNDYHYSIQVVQTALNRLAKGKAELVAMKNNNGKKTYVKRK